MQDLRLCSDTGDDQASRRAVAWLEDCTQRHEKCATARAQPTNPPTRLLEIDAPSPGLIRVVDTTRVVQYATLSHCWGSARILTLTTESRDKLYAGTEVGNLPLSFQHAIKVVRALSIPFLWIDSLCIYQDSVTDWQREAGTMSDVYRGGILNVAATGAANGHQGFFRQRDPEKIQPRYVRASFESLPPAWYTVLAVAGGVPDSPIAAEPLLRRGWVVQERVLATTLLHYAETQLWWECHELAANESHPSGLPPVDARKLRAERAASELLQLPTEADRDKCLDCWENLCKMYSKTALTKSYDKLIAVSGMANRMREVCQDNYLAGLWRHKLETQLLWSASRCTRPETYRAPSWSWASVDGSITPNPVSDARQIALAEVVDAGVELAGENPTGQVNQGFVRLRGYLATMTLRMSTEHSFTEHLSLLNGEELGSYNPRCWGDPRDVESEDVGTRLHCMPITFTRFGAGDGWFSALMLQPTGRQKGQFRRCGKMTGKPRGQSAERDILHNVTHFFSKPDRKLDEWFEYEKSDGIDRYTISII